MKARMNKPKIKRESYLIRINLTKDEKRALKANTIGKKMRISFVVRSLLADNGFLAKYTLLNCSGCGKRVGDSIPFVIDGSLIHCLPCHEKTFPKSKE